VPFYDCDAMGIVWHGNYIKYLEDARCALLDKIGYNYRAMHQDGYMWPIATVKTKYIKSCTFGQQIAIKATLEEYENRIKVKYLITDSQTGDILLKGETVQMAVNIETMESCFSSPKKLIEQVDAYMESIK
jgi:acyl-CoA thioester hydrolase